MSIECTQVLCHVPGVTCHRKTCLHWTFIGECVNLHAKFLDVNWCTRLKQVPQITLKNMLNHYHKMKYSCCLLFFIVINFLFCVLWRKFFFFIAIDSNWDTNLGKLIDNLILIIKTYIRIFEIFCGKHWNSLKINNTWLVLNSLDGYMSCKLIILIYTYVICVCLFVPHLGPKAPKLGRRP